MRLYNPALALLAHEGLALEAYKDSVGVWTWSVGITSASGHDVERYIRKPTSVEHALEVFVWALGKYAQEVDRALPNLTEAQFAAALSFHYNTGAIGRASWVKLWKAGKIAEARKAFMQWNKPSAIIGRRREERDLFFDGKWPENMGTVLQYRVSNSRPVSPVRVHIEAQLKKVMFGGTPTPTPTPTPGQGMWPAIAGIIATIAAAVAAWLFR